MTGRPAERMTLAERASDERWEDIRRRFEEGRRKRERARERYLQLERRHERIRKASGLRGAFYVMFPSPREVLTRTHVIIAVILAAVLLAVALILGG